MLQNHVGDGVVGFVADRKVSFQVFDFDHFFELTVAFNDRLAQIVVADAEVGRQRRAVNGEGAAGQRRRAQRQHGRRAPRRGEPLPVAGQRPEVGQRPVAPGDGLGVLQVGVAGQG